MPVKLLKLLYLLIITFLAISTYYMINIGNKYIGDNRKIRFNFRKALPLMVFLIVVFFYSYLSKNYPIVSDTMKTIIVSIILAYLFNPLVDFFEAKGIDRRLGILIIYLLILALIFILSFLVIPRSIKEFKKLFTVLPTYLESWGNSFQDFYNKYLSKANTNLNIFESIQESVLDNVEKLQKAAFGSITTLFNGVVNMFSKMISLVLAPILTFYFLKDKKYFIEKSKNMIPKKHREETLELFSKINISLNQFVRGRLILALYVGIATTILLLILKVEFAGVIGLITCIADIIPYIGPFLGFLPAVFFAFLSSPMKALWVILIFLLIQWVENNVLAPKIIGQSTGIHPMSILLGLIVGGGMFGVVGMIFSIPFISVVKILVEHFYGKIKESRFMKAD